MPAIPVILTVAEFVAPEIIASIGASVASAVGVSTVSAATATAIGAGTISGVSTLAMGGSPEQALKSAVLSGAGSYVGGAASKAVGGGALGAAAGSAASTAVQGGSAQDVIRNAFAGGFGGFVGQQTGSQTLGRGIGAAISSKGDPLRTVLGAARGFAVDYPDIFSGDRTPQEGAPVGQEGEQAPGQVERPTAERSRTGFPIYSARDRRQTGYSPQTSRLLGTGPISSLPAQMGALPVASLSSGRGAVSSEETGGPRENVWNVESLRYGLGV